MAIYYVDPSGSDAEDGLTTGTAWQTIAKVNATALTAGDQVLFKAGGTWLGGLIIDGDGTVGSPIIVGRYGAGDDPIISGSVLTTTWAKTDGYTNIYETALDSTYLDVAAIHTTVATVANWHVFENATDADPKYLTAAASLAACDGAAASCYYDGTADKMYIHTTGSGNPASNSLEYRIPVVWCLVSTCPAGADNDYITIQNLHLKHTGRYLLQGHDIGDDYFTHHLVVEDCLGEHSRHDGFTAWGITAFTRVTCRNVRANGAFVLNQPLAEWPITNVFTLTDCVYEGAADGTLAQAATIIHLHNYTTDVTVDGLTISGTAQSILGTTATGSVGDILVKNVTVAASAVIANFVRLQCACDSLTIGDAAVVGSGIVAVEPCTLDRGVKFDVVPTNFLLTQSVLPGSSAEFGIGVEFAGTTGVNVTRTILDGFWKGVNVGSAATSGVVDHCTIINSTRAGAEYSAAGLTITNTIFEGNTHHIRSTSTTSPLSNYNLFYAHVTAQFNINGTNGTLAQWTAATGEDVNSLSGDPVLDANYFPLYTSEAIGSGTSGSTIGARDVAAILQGNILISSSAPTVTVSAAAASISITVPQGDNVLSLFAPTRHATDHKWITPPADDLILSLTAPASTRTDHRWVTIPLDDIVFSSVAPVSSTTYNHWIDAPSGNITVTETAPILTVTTSESVEPPAVSLTITPTAPVVGWTDHQARIVPQGSIIVGGTAPVAVHTTNAVTVPGSDDLSLSYAAPVVAWSDNHACAIPQGTVVLSALAPVGLRTDHRWIALPAEDLVLSFDVPGVQATASGERIPPQGNVALLGIAPTVGWTTNAAPSVPVDNVVLSTAAPVVGWTDVRIIVVPHDDLALVSTTPVVAVTAEAAIDVPSGTITLTAQAPTISAHTEVIVPAADLSLSGSTPIVTEQREFALVAGSLTLTGTAPVVAHVDNHVAAVPSGAATLTGTASTVVVPDNRWANTPSGSVALTPTSPTATITLGATIRPVAGQIVVTGAAPALNDQVVLALGSGALTITTTVPQLAKSSKTASIVLTDSLVDKVETSYALAVTASVRVFSSFEEEQEVYGS